MSFLSPGWLWLLALVPLLWFYPRRLKDRGHGIIRSALFAALILGMSRPVIVRDDQAPSQVFVLDQSKSLSDARAREARDCVERLARAMPQPCRKVLVELASSDRRSPKKPAFVDEVIRVDAEQTTSIASALELAANAISDGAPGAVTLISDGRATDRAWGAAISDLQRRGIALHCVELASDDVEPRPVALRFDETMRSGHSARAMVRVLGQAEEIALILESGEATLARKSGLALDGRLDLVLDFEAPAAGFHDVRLRVEVVRGRDARPTNNTLASRIAVQDPLRVLYLGERVQGARQQMQDLLGKGFELREPSDDDGIELLETADVVVLDDRPARSLSAKWRKAIQQAVEARGLGLFASGGRAAFGAGGYHRTEIEEMLPVDFVQKEEKKDPSTTLAIIIDTSGSMVGNRMTLAKQVARLAMRRLQPHDKVGIVEFYGTKTWAAPIQSAANQIDLQRALNRLAAQGGTVLMPAIEEAYYAMKNVQTRYKHVLVLTDAGVETGPYEALCRRMNDEGMTVSTVLVGPGRHSDFLVDLADWGGGRYYNAADRFNLPELLLKKPSTSVLPSYRPERTEVEASGGRGWWGNVDPRQLPPVDGFVESELREGAESLITTKRNAAPLLATTLHGLGRVTALMTEPLGSGTASWKQWPGYGALLGRVLARTARGQQPPFELDLRRRGEWIRLEARRLVRADVKPSAEIFAEGGAAEPLALSEVAPGLFRASLRWPSAKPCDLRVSSEPVRFARTLIVSPAKDDVAAETQVDPAGAFPMDLAAAATGGLYSADATASLSIPVPKGIRPLGLVLLWPWFVLVALLLFAFDVFYRRRARSDVEFA